MELITKLMAKEWFMIPVFGLCIFIIVYLWIEQIYDYLKKKSLSKRGEIIDLLKLMGVDVDQKKLTITILLMSFGLGGLVFLLLWPNIIAGLLFSTSIIIAGWSLPLLIVKSMYSSRCSKFVSQMVDGLTIMANGISAGSNPQEAMKRVVEIMKNPMKYEFNKVLAQMQVGDSFENALNDLGTRIPKPDVQMFVTSINILKETGGNLAETFQTIVSTIRERQKIEKKIEAMTAQGLMQGVIVTMIPFVLCVVFFVVDPAFISPMFNTTLGWVMLAMMLGLQIIGGVIIKKVVTIKV